MEEVVAKYREYKSAAENLKQAQGMLQESDAEIRAALNTNLCRCGTQNRVVKAILRAAKGGASS